MTNRNGRKPQYENSMFVVAYVFGLLVVLLLIGGLLFCRWIGMWF